MTSIHVTGITWKTKLEYLHNLLPKFQRSRTINQNAAVMYYYTKEFWHTDLVAARKIISLLLFLPSVNQVFLIVCI